MIDRELVLDGLAELADPDHQERAWTGTAPGKKAHFAECTRKLFEDSGLSAALGPNWFFGRGVPFGPVVFSRKIDIALRMLRTMTVRINDQPMDRLTTDPRITGCRNAAAWVLDQVSHQTDP